jgi:hypothetical protein
LCAVYTAWTWCKTAKRAYLEISSSSKHVCNMRLPAGGEKAVGVVFCVLLIQRGRDAKLRRELI